MSRYEEVLIDTDTDLDDVAATVERATGGTRNGFDQDDIRILLSDTAVGFLGNADYDDERGLPLSRYRYRMQIKDLNRDESWFGAQVATARRVYQDLAGATEWALMLALDDAQIIDARRDGLAHSA